ncbi:MAG: membrane protein insertase YidC, partial [Alistipes sp.]|nr:membrane protein insertase YidC [Alistipes sp.]
MDKKSIIGIVVIALLFAGFTFYSSREQKRYQQELAQWQAYQDSVAAASAPAVLPADAAGSGSAAESVTTEQEQQRRVSLVGETLAAAEAAAAEEFTVENDVMTVRFSTRGGQIKGVTLKDYTKYAPRHERHQPVELFDPASARFALTFYVKNGTNNVPVNTADYTFAAEPVRTTAEGAQSVVMRLPVSGGAWLEYEYLIYNG